MAGCSSWEHWTLLAALVAAIFIGKRRRYGRDAFMPHSLGMTLLGAGVSSGSVGSALTRAAQAQRMLWPDLPFL